MGDHTHKHIFIFFYLREICPRQLPQTHVRTSAEPDLVMGWAASTRVPKHQGPQGGVVKVVWDILWTSDPTLVTRTEGCPYRHLHARPRLQGQSMKRWSALLERPHSEAAFPSNGSQRAERPTGLAAPPQAIPRVEAAQLTTRFHRVCYSPELHQLLM